MLLKEERGFGVIECFAMKRKFLEEILMGVQATSRFAYKFPLLSLLIPYFKLDVLSLLQSSPLDYCCEFIINCSKLYWENGIDQNVFRWI